jgi:hypothetical protein
MQDLDLPADVPAATSANGPFVAPPPGLPVTQRWLIRSKLAAEHIAAGSFDTALRMLRLQLGLSNFEPLKPNMLALHAAAFAHVSGLPGLPSVLLGIDSTWSRSSATAPPVHPVTPFKLSALEKRMVEAYEHVSKNLLPDALDKFTAILLMVPLLAVETRKEVDDVKELLNICREYHTGLRCELERRAVRPILDPPVLLLGFAASAAVLILQGKLEGFGARTAVCSPCRLGCLPSSIIAFADLSGCACRRRQTIPSALRSWRPISRTVRCSPATSRLR